MINYRVLRPRRGRMLHAALEMSLDETLCKRVANGWILEADTIPTCRRCLETIAFLAGWRDPCEAE